MTQPCVSFPSDITWAIPPRLQNKCPQSKDREKCDNFLPLMGTVHSRETSIPLSKSPTSPFSLLASHRGHSRSTLRCVCYLLSLLRGDGCSGAVAEWGRLFFSIRKELVCTRSTQELNGRGTGKEQKGKTQQRADSIVVMGWVQHVN